ncbi:hypothetical protein GCM10010156_65280 [Planobispora rosea]|uniref:Uncharacterized protein n=1 Tax=Planobispora rosea TaxID=35762 RepID=A0A8J3WG12_PLARO|nr:hypothetical protein GCM10010156_65280 [Planobispora rosea]GIH87933.1 hypothetical protein Pro02_63410 [Planobispora rosea]
MDFLGPSHTPLGTSAKESHDDPRDDHAALRRGDLTGTVVLDRHTRPEFASGRSGDRSALAAQALQSAPEPGCAPRPTAPTT